MMRLLTNVIADLPEGIAATPRQVSMEKDEGAVSLVTINTVGGVHS